MASLRIHLLGPFRVFRNGQPLDASEWRSLQVRTILKLLLTRQGHVVSTDQLMDVLWPDDDLQTARRRLHVRMSQLRRALDPEHRSAHVLAVEGGYTLNPESDYWLDTVEFEARAQWGRRCQENDNPAQAITAYEEAIRLDPDYTWPYLSLGAIYERHGEQDQASALYQQATRRHRQRSLV